MNQINTSNINYNINKPIDKILVVAQNPNKIKPNEWMCQCPGHKDDKASLHITETNGGTLLLKCHAGCRNTDIVKAWGLEMKDLFPPREHTPNSPQQQEKPQIVAIYDFKDADNKLIYQIVRQAYSDGGKTFKGRRPDEKGGYIWNLQGVEPRPYRLPELLQTIQNGKMVLVVEGEKDVETLYKLGITATCNHGGAGKWREFHSKYFPPSSKVTILPDNDEPGHKHGQSVAGQLRAIGCEVRIIGMPGLPEHGDVSDWLKTHNKDELMKLIIETWDKPMAQPAQEPDRKGIANNQLKPVITCLDDIEIEEVNWLWFKFIATRKLTMLEGDPGDGKTFMSLALIAIITNGWPFPDEDGNPDRKRVREPGNVIYMTAEDGLADTVKPRLEMLGADHKRVHILEGYIRDDDPDNMHQVVLTDLNILRATFEQVRPVLLVVDPLQAYLGAGVDMHRANEVRPVLTGIMRLAEQFNTAVVFIRHLNKASGGKALYRGMGSIDFNAAARSVLLVGRDPENKHKRVVIQTKSSLIDEAPSIGFTLDENGFTWTGVSELTADQVLSQFKEDGESKSALEEAVGFIQDALCNGPVKVREVKKQSKDADISPRTLRRAKEELKIKSFKAFGSDGDWYWELSKLVDQVGQQYTNGQDGQHVKNPDNKGLEASGPNGPSKLIGQHGQGKNYKEMSHDLWNDIGHVIEGGQM